MNDERGVDVVHVVVPARNEETLLPRHLASLRAATDELRKAHGHVEVRVTLVLDSCTDGSRQILEESPWVDVVEVESGVVGEVRAAGVARVRELAGGRSEGSVWVACTDADTVVPPSWLVEQVALAARGSMLVIGTVVPDPRDLTPEVLSRWQARHWLGEGHAHVHGANLGFTLGAYDAVGGFERVHTGEDARLVARMQRAGIPWCATARTQVVTSGRRLGRVRRGFWTYLVELAP